MISIIVAYSENRVIGNQNRIPWRIPEDMKHFKESTTGCPVIMGRKTYDSFPNKFKPLPNRTNIIITRNPQPNFDSVVYTDSLETATGIANKIQDNSWIIGGAEIYNLALQKGVVDRIVASEVKGDYNGDCYFPDIGDKWERILVASFEQFNIVHYLKK